jgi:hypothetical protein
MNFGRLVSTSDDKTKWPKCNKCNQQFKHLYMLKEDGSYNLCYECKTKEENK